MLSKTAEGSVIRYSDGNLKILDLQVYKASPRLDLVQWCLDDVFQIISRNLEFLGLLRIIAL